jgi:hypothetical protein
MASSPVHDVREPGQVRRLASSTDYAVVARMLPAAHRQVYSRP